MIEMKLTGKSSKHPQVTEFKLKLKLKLKLQLNYNYQLINI
jgi:hypothetical protein